MENISSLKSLFQRGDLVTTLDWKDAYLSVPVHRESSSWFFLSGSTATHSYGCNPLRASAVERTKHISVRELKATFFALKSFPKKQSHKTFCLSIGNTTAVNRKQQGRNAVNLSRRVNTGTPELVPGAEHIGNSSACTRQIEHSGRLWIEGAQRQQRVESWPVCFLTSRLPKYVSWRLDPEVLFSDALTINWTTFMGYAFSPFHFILAVLSKVSCDQADIILVAPLWKAQPWCHLSWVFWSIIQSFFLARDTF